MTVIAWDGKTLAGDRLGDCGGMKVQVTKIHRINGHLLGGAGSAAKLAEFFAWFREGADPDAWPISLGSREEDGRGFTAMVITPEKDVLLYENSGAPFKVENHFMAIGSGAEYAMTAMACGKTAREGVLLAGELSTHCGLGADTLALEAAQ